MAIEPCMRISALALGALLAGDALAANSSESQLTPCHVPAVEGRAQCVDLQLPEDWSQPEGESITVHVAILPPSGGQATRAPLYLLAGGPGQAATQMGRFISRALERARRGREVVLVDQRGTGRSTPFECEISNDPHIGGDEVARKCLSNTSQRPQHFHSAAFIRDLEAVRKYLGHGQINLLGGSYGTRAGLLYLRAYPQHVRTLTLDAVAAPATAFMQRSLLSASEALNNVLQACAAQPHCATAFPQLATQLNDIRQSLRQQPVVVQADFTLSITEDVFLNALRNALYSAEHTAMLPYIISQFAAQNYAPWLAVGQAWESTYAQMSVGTMLSVLCAEEVPRTSAEQARELSRGKLFANVDLSFWFDACKVWPSARFPDGYGEPVVSDVPTLLLSGALDPVTPPHFADVAAATLSRSRHIVAPYNGHITSAYACIPKLLAQFLDSADPQALDPGCIEQLSRTPFVVDAAGPTP